MGSLVQGAIGGFGLLRVGAGLCDGRDRPEAVSRWSARSEARTYDLDAVEDGRMMAAAGGDWDGLAGSGLLWVIGVGGARRDALPYLGARTASAVRRRDDRWGDPRCVLRSLVLSEPTSDRWRQEHGGS